VLAADGRLRSIERRVAMVPTMPKRVVVYAVLTAWVLGVSGCVKQSEYDAKVAELRRQVEKSAKTEKQVLQLQKDLDAAKHEVEKAAQAKNDLETTIKTMQQDNSDLKDRVKRLSQAEEKMLQLQKDFDAAKLEITTAKHEIEKTELAKKDAEAKIKMLEQENANLKSLRKKHSGAVENLSGAWKITLGNNVFAARLEALGSNNYRLGPKNLGFSGIYLFDGAALSMVGENPRYPDLVWSMKKAGLFELVAGHYVGASMTRTVAGGSPSKP
jgi:predicted RNase H-like nuclease (RuvC/YqgF family)